MDLHVDVGDRLLAAVGDGHLLDVEHDIVAVLRILAMNRRERTDLGLRGTTTSGVAPRRPETSSSLNSSSWFQSHLILVNVPCYRICSIWAGCGATAVARPGCPSERS